MLKKKDLSAEQIEEIRNYYREGHAATEVCKVFNISIHTAKGLCEGCRSWRLNQYSCSAFDNLANIKAKIADRLPNWEYAGNYTGTDGKCDIRCKTCGTIKTVCSVAIRHGSARCPVCYDRERAECKERKKIEREAERQRREEQRQIALEMQRQENIRRKEEQKRKDRLDHTAVYTCKTCGGMFLADDRYKHAYCSVICQKRADNKKRELRRRIKIENQMVDRDISLERLYQRDGGICYLCGNVCDWNDKKTVDGTIICGDNYPSIEHVIPLSKNGKHSWANVRLACRKCNTYKGDRLIADDKRLA